MSQQRQAPLPRQEFQEWLENAAAPVLVLQKGKHLGSVVKVPATPEIDYLFGCETFYGERISWSDRLEFCGLYDRQHQALHLLDDPLPDFVSGLTEEECQDSTAFGKRIAQEVDRYVEAAISNDRSRLSVRELTSERNINSYRYYKGTEAGREAASLVFSGEKPDVQFHSEYYTSLTEDTLLSYLKSPEDYIKTTAEQYMRDNQEEFLAQFLKKDALLAEYQMLSQDSDAPVYRMRAITDALQKSGAKTVNVTVQKDGVELTFKTSAESLKGLKSQYSTWYIAPSDRLQFRHLFGAGSDYSAEDIIRIAYGRSTLYRKAVTQVGMAWGLPIWAAFSFEVKKPLKENESLAMQRSGIFDWRKVWREKKSSSLCVLLPKHSNWSKNSVKGITARARTSLLKRQSASMPAMFPARKPQHICRPHWWQPCAEPSRTVRTASPACSSNWRLRST